MQNPPYSVYILMHIKTNQKKRKYFLILRVHTLVYVFLEGLQTDIIILNRAKLDTLDLSVALSVLPGLMLHSERHMAREEPPSFDQSVSSQLLLFLYWFGDPKYKMFLALKASLH